MCVADFDNLLLLTDSYKVSHWKQYPPGCERVYSYFESRSGEFPEVVFFGLQYLLKKCLCRRIESWMIDEAEEFVDLHFAGCGGSERLFHRGGWEHIVRDHGGWLPLRIKAVPEGTRVGTRNVLMTVENTCPQCFWLTNYVETLLVQVWYPTTVATLSNHYWRIIHKHLLETGDAAGVDFKLQDFGFRGSPAAWCFTWATTQPCGSWRPSPSICWTACPARSGSTPASTTARCIGSTTFTRGPRRSSKASCRRSWRRCRVQRSGGSESHEDIDCSRRLSEDPAAAAESQDDLHGPARQPGHEV